MTNKYQDDKVRGVIDRCNMDILYHYLLTEGKLVQLKNLLETNVLGYKTALESIRSNPESLDTPKDKLQERLSSIEGIIKSADEALGIEK